MVGRSRSSRSPAGTPASCVVGDPPDRDVTVVVAEQDVGLAVAGEVVDADDVETGAVEPSTCGGVESALLATPQVTIWPA